MVNANQFKTEKRYLSAKDDAEHDGKTLIIDSVFPETIKGMTGESKDSLCVRFKDVKKILSLNQTNLTLLTAAFGEDTDEWINKKVKFAVVAVKMQGQIAQGIQVTPVK